MEDAIFCPLYVDIRIATNGRQDLDLDIWSADFVKREINTYPFIQMKRVISHHKIN